MRIALRARLATLLAGILVTLGLGIPVSIAQAQAPTAQQLQTFQNLSPEEQQALLRQIAGGANTNATPDSTAPGNDIERGRTATDEAARRIRDSQEEREPLIPVLKPDDTVLVQIDLRENRPLLQRGAPGTPQVGGSQQPGQSSASGQNQADSRQPRVPELEPEERRKLEGLVDLVRSRNPYKLDRNAQLILPGFAPIALGGLTELQATQRLSAEPVLLKLDVAIIRMPLAKTGIEGLKRFGYDLFDNAPSTFSPVTDVPVPADFIVGPGDELKVQLFGGQNRNFSLQVSREGTVSFPELGPIRVAGQTFNAAKASIEARVAREMTGVRADVSMGDVRSVRVFVLGESRRPGSYTVSGLATMTTALFTSGGVKPIGSLRDIQLKRQGAVVRHLDLYDLLIQGNTSDDAKLQPGDVIFIPPVGPVVSVEGEVKRPAIYELKGEADVADVLQIAGGLTPEADRGRASLTQVDDKSFRRVFDVSLASETGRNQGVRNGDILRVARLRPQIDSGVAVDGFVHRPGLTAWREGLRLSDIIASVDELRPNADQHYILIRRESGPDRHVEVLSADLTAALAAPGSTADVALQPRDRITIFDLGPGRERIIKPLLDELRLQSAISRPTEVVRVEGKVKVPGEYPLEPGMKVSDLLRAGGNLESAAFGGKAELARYAVTADGSRQTELIAIDLAAVRRAEPGADVPLQPFDYLLIKETPNWTDQEEVILTGEVLFPGTYPIRRGETLHQVLMRAGGLTSSAFPKGSAFTREELREREQKQLDMLSDRLQTDLASLSLQAAAANQAGASQALIAGQSLLGQLRQTKAVGRLVIDLAGVVAGEAGSAKDVILKNGDRLVIPQQKPEVTVIGEVQSATSHFYSKSLGRDDYIALSGGMTRKADKGKIYVVRADGSVSAEQRSLFARSYAISIQPGDTIVVPLDTERMPRLPFWQAITQILYNLAISAAAINSF
jgi:protein involved in polysaccharide export with SLBB domain